MCFSLLQNLHTTQCCGRLHSPSPNTQSPTLTPPTLSSQHMLQELADLLVSVSHMLQELLVSQSLTCFKSYQSHSLTWFTVTWFPRQWRARGMCRITLCAYNVLGARRSALVQHERTRGLSSGARRWALVQHQSGLYQTGPQCNMLQVLDQTVAWRHLVQHATLATVACVNSCYSHLLLSHPTLYSSTSLLSTLACFT